MKKRRLYESDHPFDEQPFEALCCGSWRPVELIKIENGSMTIHFSDKHHVIVANGPFSNLRVKSRQATLSDCTCYLRPGIDVCVLSSSQQTESSEEEGSEPVFVDARISSIERKPHDSQCSCRFFVNLYVNQGPLGSEKGKLSKEAKDLGIDELFILQKLEKCPSEGQFYRWDTSTDCTLAQKTKLLLGKFSSEVTWLLVASVLKQIAFQVRSVQNKIIYQILAGDDNSSLETCNNLNCVNFKVEDGILTPIVVQFVPPANASETGSGCDIYGDEWSPHNDEMNLRRSKRRNVRPERFLGCDILPDTHTGWVRMMPYTPEKWKEDDLYLPLSCLFGTPAICSKEQAEQAIQVYSPKQEPIKDFSVQKRKRGRPREVKSTVAIQKEDKDRLAIVPVLTETNPLAIENSPTKTSKSNNCSRENDGVSYGYYSAKSSAATQNRTKFEGDDFLYDSRWKRKPLGKKIQNRRYRPLYPRRSDSYDPMNNRRRTLSAGAYNTLINSYMKNIDATIMSKEETHIIDQWEQFKASKNNVQQEEMEPSAVDEEEVSETEMLWREMEICLASAYLLEENEAQISAQCMEKSSEHCKHQFKMDEEVGIMCQKCGFVKTEIKYVSAPFMEYTSWTAENKPYSEDLEPKSGEDMGLKVFPSHASSGDALLSEENDNVWALIPKIRSKLHLHQKKAFEFLWKNIAGSMVPARMEKASKKIGGCVISHTPGAGKTFLIIAFLASYLKLFPGKRPLVLAPKTTLYTWYKEFIKWETPVPVHLIHGRRSYRVFKEQQRAVAIRGGPLPSQDVMHVLDCLEKIQKWHAKPSVLVMGYTSFLTLMREDSKFAHRKYMAKVLRESPGLLILDEGHNPRSTKSRLRKVLMKVETDLRILLSGTLFQNNFCEYFNTLCLARPKFIREVLKELDPKFRRKKKVDKARHLLESRARKFFIDTIARKIDSPVSEEKMEGLNMLKNLTNGFIDVYEGGASDGLPGLQIYTILMNSTPIQQEILDKLRRIMSTYNGYPLELELLITLASIHPWLVKTSECVRKFFSQNELLELEKLRFDFKRGSKVMFVLNLMFRIIRKEKVLIFCHNIAPINIFVELFESVFRWQRGREILVLTGNLELFERGRVMDKFEELGGPSRVLLASITACAEGISLTAASRVILMDSEWNPSKTKQAIARAFRPGQQRMVYVYQLLATNTLEEDKYSRTTWKEWVSSMIFSEEFIANPSRWQAQKIEDEVLREMVEEDRVKSFHKIMKNEKASTG